MCASINEVNERAITIYNSDDHVISNKHAALIISDNLKIKPIQCDAPNVVAVQILDFGLIIVSVYLRPYQTTFSTADAIAQVSLIQTLINNNRRHKFVIMGDINGVHESWSTPRQIVSRITHDPNAKLINKLITDNKLTIVNSRRIPTFDLTEHTLDLIVVSQDIQIIRSSTIPFFGSDHSALFAMIKDQKLASISMRKLIISTWKAKEIKQIQCTVNRWTKQDPIIQQTIALKHHPENHGIWNSKKSKIRFKNITFIQRRLKGKFKKRKTLKPTTLQQQKIVEMRRTWIMIKKQVLKPTEGIDWRKQIAQESKKVWLNPFISTKPDYFDIPSNIRGRLTNTEVESIKKMKFKTSSMSADNFTSYTWTKFFEVNLPLIIKTIDNYFYFSHIPQMLTTLGCGFIPKPDGSVRMVKTPSYLYKIIDNILKDRLLMEMSNLIDLRYQYAYICGSERKNLIYDLLMSDEYANGVAMIQLDVSKAFDTVSLTTALNKIEKIMDPSTTALIKSTLLIRYVVYHEDNQRLYKCESEGVPQGTATGPLLFIIALNEALITLAKQGIRIWAYADDMILILNTKQLKNKDLIMHNISVELEKINLHLNLQKTKLILPIQGLILGEYLDKKRTGLNQAAYHRQLDAQREKVMTDFNVNIYRVKYMPIAHQRLIVNQLISPKFGIHEFCQMVKQKTREDLVKVTGLMIQKWGSQLKLLTCLNIHSSNQIPLLKYAITHILTQLKSVVYLRTMAVGTNRFPPTKKYDPQMRKILELRRVYTNSNDIITIGTKKSLNWCVQFASMETTRQILTTIDLPGCKSSYEAQLVGLEHLLATHGKSHITISKTKEMILWGAGYSKFIRGVELIMSKYLDGNWNWVSNSVNHQWREDPGVVHSPYIFNLMSITRCADMEANNLYVDAWKLHKTIWTIMYPTAKVVKMDRFVQLDKAFRLFTIQMECCDQSKSGYDHLLLYCPWIKGWVTCGTYKTEQDLIVDKMTSEAFNLLLDHIEVLNQLMTTKEVLDMQ